MKTYTITTRYINEYVRVVEAKSKKEALEIGLELDARHGSVFSDVYRHNEKVEITPDAEVSHVESATEKAAWAGQSAIGAIHSNEIAPRFRIKTT
jgi:hypothetical protein